MKKLPKKLTPRLRREPAELLEVTRHRYQPQIDREIVAAFPVVFTQSLESLLVKLLPLFAVIGVVAWVAARINPQVGFLALICMVVAGTFLMPSNKSRFGIVAVTDADFVLIELSEGAFENAQVTERIDRPTRLPKARPCKGGGVHSDALPFAKSGDKGWRYAILADRGTGYVSLLEELSTSKKLNASAELVASV